MFHQKFKKLTILALIISICEVITSKLETELFSPTIVNPYKSAVNCASFYFYPRKTQK
ncbi:hypothetical protein HMPREF1118_0797 [Haemophilus parainfluenzae HK262]|nr:hypothetical protein HMPREF1118_0797 [Haemophilus parainfluenzae HK262]